MKARRRLPLDNATEVNTSQLAYGPTEWDDYDVPPLTTGLSNEKMTMWAFLGSDCLLFAALISTYLLLRNRVGPDTDGSTAAELFDIPFTSVSSFVLLMSSLTMVLAVTSIGRGEIERCKMWLLTTATLGAVFIAGQVYEFTGFYREGLGFTTNISSSAFFTLTGFHGVHVSLGIIMLVTLWSLISRGNIGAERAETVEIIGLYWHFVDIVWIVIFAVVYLIP
ncbi:MAG: heme/copper-type cytochrome/quinol oxidase subunit 3 [Candidatus Poriferisodalaceae bacterium]|jgi:heme/copper-type cytochrome/quinol oxidase subunit 3|tara:strand:- start:151 stop:819 length:669 start_codon:yes stop_codon:yes gene_type:complete